MNARLLRELSRLYDHESREAQDVVERRRLASIAVELHRRAQAASLYDLIPLIPKRR